MIKQITANVLKGKDAEVRGLKVTEEFEFGSNYGTAGTGVEATNGLGVRKTVITLDALPITVADATPYGGVKVFEFPAVAGKLIAAAASLQVAVTTDRITTINASAAMDYSVGTAAEAADATLDSTQANIIAKQDIPLDGTDDALSTAVKGTNVTDAAIASGASVYLNYAFPTGTDIDADGDIEVTGQIVLVWVDLI